MVFLRENIFLKSIRLSQDMHEEHKTRVSPKSRRDRRH